MTEGRRALYRQGLEKQGPINLRWKTDMLHFHEFLRRELKTEL